MANTFFTPEDIIALHEKHGAGNLFHANTNETKINKNKDHPTYYIPFTCITMAGRHAKLSLKIKKQILSSSAKISHGQTDQTANDVRVSYTLIEEKDLFNTDYPEDKRAELIKMNANLIKALDIIADEYELMINREIIPYEGDKFALKQNQTINSFRQTHRKASLDEIAAEMRLAKEERRLNKLKKLPLPRALYRIKIPANTTTKKLGRVNFQTKKHEFIVFDARKSTAENKFKPVVAKLKSDGKLVDLTVSNAKHFITYMSLSGGRIDFHDTCVSQSGISLTYRFNDLHIWPHKPMKTETMTDDDMAEMAEAGTSGFNDDLDIGSIDEPDVEIKAPGKTTKPIAIKTKAIIKPIKKVEVEVEDEDAAEVDADGAIVDDTAEEFMNDEPEENDADVDAGVDTEPSVVKKQTPPKTIDKTKVAGKKSSGESDADAKKQNRPAAKPKKTNK